MNKSCAWFALGVLHLVVHFPASADHASLSGELGISKIDFDGPEELSFNTLIFRASYRPSKVFGAEIEIGSGLRAERVEAQGFDVHVDLESVFGVFAVAHAPISDQLDVVGRVGYSEITVKADAGFGDARDAQSGAAVGVGVHYVPIGSSNGVRLNYSRHYRDDFDVNALTVTFVRSF